MAVRQRRISIQQQLALALSFILLATAGGDLGHALGGTGHEFESAVAMTAGGPADSSTPDPTSSHVATECPFCRLVKTSDTALSEMTMHLASLDERPYVFFSLESSAHSSPHGRPDTARAPPTQLYI